MLSIEVAYAKPESQLVIGLQVEDGTTIEQAIRESGILRQFPEIDLAVNKVGIFGKQASLRQAVRTGDRIEIYRRLTADPKQSRRQKARR